MTAAVVSILIFIDGRIITPDLSFETSMVYVLASLFVWCMVCHGELVRLRPEKSLLTQFYLAVSLGGAVGGLFVGVLAPAIFNSYLELHISLLLLAGLLTRLSLADVNGIFGPTAPKRYRNTLKLSFIGLIAATTTKMTLGNKHTLSQSRNFYGVLQVNEKNPESPQQHMRVQKHGQIIHGSQFQSAEKKLYPTEYYGRQGGIGAAFHALEERENREIAIVGLGVGTIKAYAKPADRYSLYEINPDVVQQAKNYFTFLDSTPGSYQTVIGDGRLSLEKTSSRFDLLVLDAFSSDSIPVHLLTLEAFELYLSRIKPDGVLAVHVSNRHLEVSQVVGAAASQLNLQAYNITDPGNEELGTCDSEWVLISRDPVILSLIKSWRNSYLLESKLERAWSDDYSNLFSILQ